MWLHEALAVTSRGERLEEYDASAAQIFAVGGKHNDQDGRSFHHRPRSASPNEDRRNVGPTVMDGRGKHTRCYRTMAGMPAWHRRSHVPGWGDAVATGSRGGM